MLQVKINVFRFFRHDSMTNLFILFGFYKEVTGTIVHGGYLASLLHCSMYWYLQHMHSLVQTFFGLFLLLTTIKYRRLKKTINRTYVSIFSPKFVPSLHAWTCTVKTWNYIHHPQSRPNIYSKWVKLNHILNSNWFQWGRSASFQWNNIIFAFLSISKNELMTFIKQNVSLQCLAYNRVLLQKVIQAWGLYVCVELFGFVNYKDNSYTVIGNSKMLLLKWLLTILLKKKKKKKYGSAAIILREGKFHYQRTSLPLL